MSGEVLIDNFTLQGSHRYFYEGDTNTVTSQCLAILLDALILYEKVSVPSLGSESHYGIFGNALFGEYEDKQQWNEIISAFADTIPIQFVDPVIPRLGYHYGAEREFLNSSHQLTIEKARSTYGSRNFGRWGHDLESELPFPSYDPVAMSQQIAAADGFRPFEEYRHCISDLVRIDPLLHRDFRHILAHPRLTNDSLEDALFSLFVGAHLYYTDYCVELARTQRMHYLPNPTRVNLINRSTYFQQQILLENVRRDIITRFEKVRRKHIQNVAQTLSFRTVSVDAPLVFNYIQRRAHNTNEVVALTKELRDSKEARAFRRYCQSIEEAIATGDLMRLSKTIQEINEVAAKWEDSLETRKCHRRINVKVFGIELGGLDIPDLVLYAKDLAKHFVFLHQLVTTV